MADIGALLGGLNDNVLPLDYEVLGGLIGESVIPGLGGVGLERSDLIIYRNNEGLIDETVLGLVRSGTKILDAMLYVMAGQPDGVRLEGPVAGCNAGLLTENDMAGNVLTGKRNLIWTIAFTLLRGHYPSADGTAIGSDIPAFMHKILGMNVSPAAVAAAVASFTLSKLDMAWMKDLRIPSWNRNSDVSEFIYELISKKRNDTKFLKRISFKKLYRAINGCNEVCHLSLPIIFQEWENVTSCWAEVYEAMDDTKAANDIRAV
ncbi:hypothetical protein OUZ56_013622 [Daphnia magna]|uniref:Uncharacterized protein n=1 Tax=Daphnia magna TaxID=35525 RepID=A0ABQ9Z6F1_9CRUS|nr:hypothetical protein OUZ56_013622 [Daphnia magna]